MKTKRLLRFYFSADSLNRALDNLISVRAVKSFGGLHGADFYFEDIAEIVGAKDGLSRLWAYLDGVMRELGDGDKRILRGYAALRCGVGGLGGKERRAIKRSLMKFTRHAYAIGIFAKEIALLNSYYCLLKVGE